MNQHIIFDRTRYTDKLRDNGVDEKTARAHSDALDGALRDAVATKADLNEVKAELKGDLADLRTVLKGDIADLRAELKGDIADLRAELKGDLADLRTELKGDIADLRTELHELEGRVNLHFVQIDAKLADISVRFADQNVRFAEQNSKFDSAKLEMLRWMIGTQITMAGVIIGVLKFVK
jgi:ribosomal protein L29